MLYPNLLSTDMHIWNKNFMPGIQDFLHTLEICRIKITRKSSIFYASLLYLHLEII